MSHEKNHILTDSSSTASSTSQIDTGVSEAAEQITEDLKDKSSDTVNG